MNDASFSGEQQEYLKGFMSGVEARRSAMGLPLGPVGQGEAVDSSDLQRVAQDRTVASGGKLVPEEEAKRRKHPLDRFDDISSLASVDKFPKGIDVFLTKFHGLFYVAPAQDSFMCRLRMPGGILQAHQFRGVAEMADELAGGYADITTRANLQLREIPARHGPEVLLRLSELGLTSRGSGADNVRNVTGSPTAGIDPQELIDTRPHARAIHHHILNHRELFGLPRKFNIAFDGGGRVPVLQETNDIAFTAVTVREGFGVEAGVYYRLAVGGITGHRDLARTTGVVVCADDTTRMCDAILRVFIANGDRTNRNKSRLKYLLDGWGLSRFLEEVERELGSSLTYVDETAFQDQPAQIKHGHIGVFAQRQVGLSYVGITCPLGRLTSEQLRGLADIADKFGSGTIRLTVWQNLLVSDIRDDQMAFVLDDVTKLGLDTQASKVCGGLVACTGSAGCKFAATNTKSHATQLAEWLDARITVDQAINIHVTGCHHSCAQHFIADIGLLGAKVEQGEELVEGYDLHIGGGCGAGAKIGRLIKPKIAFDDLPPMLLGLLRAWQTERGEDQSFQTWSAGLSNDALVARCLNEIVPA